MAAEATPLLKWPECAALHGGGAWHQKCASLAAA